MGRKVGLVNPTGRGKNEEVRVQQVGRPVRISKVMIQEKQQHWGNWVGEKMGGNCSSKSRRLLNEKFTTLSRKQEKVACGTSAKKQRFWVLQNEGGGQKRWGLTEKVGGRYLQGKAGGKILD